jgi:hypothetical protein
MVIEMREEELISKEMRVAFWESQARIPDRWELEWQKALFDSDRERLLYA